MVLDSTPFYAESGWSGGGLWLSRWPGCAAGGDGHHQAAGHLHHVKVLEGRVSEGDSLRASVDSQVRQRTLGSITHDPSAARRPAQGAG